MLRLNVGKPQVAYKETITRKITSVGKFIQQSGGRGQYGHVIVEMEPSEEKIKELSLLTVLKAAQFPGNLFHQSKKEFF
jgi:translation elongation factor 2 (EF-2/EF-G)